MAFCGTSLDFREVARTLNVLDYDTYFNLTDLAAAGDYRSALLLLDDVLLPKVSRPRPSRAAWQRTCATC